MVVKGLQRSSQSLVFIQTCFYFSFGLASWANTCQAFQLFISHSNFSIACLKTVALILQVDLINRFLLSLFNFSSVLPLTAFQCNTTCKKEQAQLLFRFRWAFDTSYVLRLPSFVFFDLHRPVSFARVAYYLATKPSSLSPSPSPSFERSVSTNYFSTLNRTKEASLFKTHRLFNIVHFFLNPTFTCFQSQVILLFLFFFLLSSKQTNKHTPST